MNARVALQNARRSLDGLSVGDAFGELFFHQAPESIVLSALPAGFWRWTDDTHMALSVVEVLEQFGRIDQDALAQAFARRYRIEPDRGYAGGAAWLLDEIASGGNWRHLAPRLFGNGSFGNGGAMRAAPIGGYFSTDPKRAAREAQLSAAVTHAHIEGQAGAMAVAVAAAMVARKPFPSGPDLLKAVLPYVPEGITRQRIHEAIFIAPEDLLGAAQKLGTGYGVSAQDTVPFCLWSAAYRLTSFEEALWWTIRGLGDRDTTCAIVGGIVSLSAPEIPAEWLQKREPLTI